MLRTLAARPGRRLLAPLALALLACAPKAPPLRGELVPVPVPRADLPPGYRRIIFQWTYSDPDVQLRGDGVARVAPPDSARLDFFLGGGTTGGRALLIGDDLSVPGAGVMERFLPPAPLLWASLGRLSIPPSPDTVVRADGDTLRADIGRNPVWRTAFVQRSLVRLERIDDSRVREWVTRDTATGRVRYEHPAGRRTLQINIVRSEPLGDLDAAIWR